MVHGSRFGIEDQDKKIQEKLWISAESPRAYAWAEGQTPLSAPLVDEGRRRQRLDQPDYGSTAS